ncbi:hypothetical protein LNTAR_06209 [Lentisphaera araneosa HTCC2155]|uniref:Uncharacterized protein n=1 Tax=Lentisphaera araneosa HTCC2155 TaxID=313628 RepID=A6DN68_9BACT|nr:hypothetical protein [Lentisphaera araneosa]EDM26816.1 hypothetical protein LNTAR_06209 [Lentisphaera araneosa HTCC2155]
MKFTLIIITLILSFTLHSQSKKSKEQLMAEARDYAEQESQKVIAQVQALMKEREAAKTDEEKAAFNLKLEKLMKENQQKQTDLYKKRKIAFFKMLYHGIKRTADDNKTLPATLDHEKIYSRIDLNTVNYIGGLSIDSNDSNDSNNIILVYEKKADEHGNRHILFLDGHVEISKEIK